MNNVFLEAYSGILSLFFTPLCLVCNQRLENHKAVVCDECWNKLQPIPLGRSIRRNFSENLDVVMSVFAFDELFQKIVHALKYQGKQSIGVELGVRMSGFLHLENIDVFSAVLTPIPLHPIKMRERGYNQSDLISAGLSQVLEIPVNTGILRRIKNTQTQTKLNAIERRENMEAAFGIGKRFDKDGIETVILVDDVFTTGSTMNAAAQVLREGGMKKIIGITAAAAE
ncbi:MAG: hypothetical protein COT43_00950 [Candidatus Marinimicrobia bacterium CG08_land_8_20_14_0_20_45_22]|nr:MAG: hypothetical protein COT43_00950 [Candidatus Marinimicrobia bacterium CG08_land_8_20_14_0_20_45_22]